MEGGLLGLRTGAVAVLAINILASFERFVGLVFEGVAFLKEELVFFEGPAFRRELAFFEGLVCLRMIIGKSPQTFLGWRSASLVPRTAVKKTR